MVRWEVAGILFIVAVGSILHFTYEASGELWWVGVFSAMNESVWEHLKLAFWPSLIWTLCLYLLPPGKNRNFWTARALALISSPFLIAVGFYWYTAALGHHVLVYDLLLFLVAVSISQFLAVFTHRVGCFGVQIRTFAVAIIVVETILFAVLSFIQPNLPIFFDPTL